MTSIARSTVALSAYNFVAASGGAVGQDLVVATVVGYHTDSGVDDAEVFAALAALLTRGLVKSTSPLVELKDPLSRVVSTRSRNLGGWDAWTVRQPGGSPVLLSEVIK